MPQTDVWIDLSAGRIIGIGRIPGAQETVHLSITSDHAISDIRPFRDELHRLLDKAIDKFPKGIKYAT